MPIDVVHDDLIDIADVAKRFRRPDGKPRHIRSIMRWVLSGVKGAHGSKPVRLEAKRVGGTWYTTEEAIKAFSNETTEQGLSMPLPAVDKKRKQKKASPGRDRAIAKLKARGMLK